MINFLKFKKIYALISTIVIGVGMLTLINYPPHLSIDFTGGSILQYQANKPLSKNAVQNILEKEAMSIYSLENTGDNNILIKTSPIDEKKELVLRQKIAKALNISLTPQRIEMVGPSLGLETIRKTILASLVAILGILLYVTFAFKKISFGIAAVIAMLHDLLVLIGGYALFSHFFGAEVDTLFVTAMLTTLSFSVHDTIVVFDKIREHQKISSFSIETMANKALTETMVRSINNSLTIVLMLVPLTLFGGETIRFFAAALLVGTITGTYSSPFVATPILVYLEERRKK